MALRPGRGSLLQEITRVNPWWTSLEWESVDPQRRSAAQAPYERRPLVLDDIQAPNLYTLRGPRRVGKSTVLKQTIVRLLYEGTDRRRNWIFGRRYRGRYLRSGRAPWSGGWSRPAALFCWLLDQA